MNTTVISRFPRLTCLRAPAVTLALAVAVLVSYSQACADWNVAALMGSDQARELLQQNCR
jgi:hypothetical protein